MIYAFSFITAFCITAIITPWVIRLARRYNLVDNPKIRFHPAQIHTGTIPRAGGLAIYIGLIITLVIFLPITSIAIGIMISLTLLMAVGLIDDYKDVNPYIRIITNSIAAIIIIACGVGIPYITNPFGGGVLPLDTVRVSFQFFGTHSILLWADIFAFLWILWTMNIIGWSAGVDGQMPGFVTIAAIVIGILALRFSPLEQSQQTVAVLAFITAGTFAGFTPWNFYPQKIMPGYGGKTLAGFLLATLGILSYSKVGTALLVLGVPTVDALYTLVRRIGKGKSPVWADRGHLHHRLLQIGWSKRKIALFYWGVSGILGAVALLVTSKLKIFTLLLTAVAFFGFIIWINFFSQLSKPRDQDNG